MKKMKMIFCFILTFVLIVSSIEGVEFSASTSDTTYSIKQIQNGSFDENIDNYKFSHNYTQPLKTVVPYWDSTAYEKKMEFFKGNSDHFNITKKYYPRNPEYLKVAEGSIAAELNADEESTIYQRIKTVAGSTYTWGLYHRGRDRTDRMVLIIGAEQPVDPSKPSKKGQDQFVRITNWLKSQFGVDYPETGCSKKYTVYSKPFAESGKFENEDINEDNNISMVETDEINQEWSVWVISSAYCNTTDETAVNGWSAYGTNASDDFDDIMKGASSSLGYDCTYTVPKGQTNTIFAFSSYSSGRETSDDITFGNLIDGIDFTLYQGMSTSITEGGLGGASVEGSESSNITIKDNIASGDALHTTVLDGQYCKIYTSNVSEGNYADSIFAGAYITINNDDGTSVTKFVEPYKGDISNMTDEELKVLSTQYFIPKNIVDPETGKEWQYYFRIAVNSPVSINLIYSKAPFVLYDSNGGEAYYFSPDNKDGGNLVGFADYFQKVFYKDVEGNDVYVDTSKYYYNYSTTTDGEGNTITIPGKYISHAALPNKQWETNDDGTSPHKFCGWSLFGDDGKQVIIDGVHTIEYNPDEGDGGFVSITDSDNSIDNLVLDAAHGITLTALWKFVHRAQAQTCDSLEGEFYNSARGGTVEETMISDDLRGTDIKEYTETVNGEERVDCVDAAGNAGDMIMFKAKPDYENDYMFIGWYYREKQADGTYTEVLRSTSTSISVTIEEGKLNTYYARFQKKTVPVIFNYSPTGSASDYDYYDKTADDKYGKYYQEVVVGDTAVKPTGDSKAIKTWYTSPTERGLDFIFDFENTPINEKTYLYSGPSFSFNYFNFFAFQEPWYIDTYGTIKFNGKYIDLRNDSKITDYNVYMLKGTLGETTPSPTYIKNNSNTIKIGLSADNEKVKYNTITNANQEFTRIGARYNDFYVFNMKTPVWVVFDFTYNGVKYTSTVKDRSLYNDITTFVNEASNGYFTSFPPETQAEIREAQKTLLKDIQGLYDAVAHLNISEPTQYEKGCGVEDLLYDSSTDGKYSFSSTTAIRNIEPWGLKYSFTVDEHEFTEFSDYGAVVLTDKEGALTAGQVTVKDLLNNENSVMYSNLKGNVYSDDSNAINIYYVDNMLASDYNKNTYAVFFVKDSDGNVYYSNIVNNSYSSIATKDTSEYADISKSIIAYFDSWSNYRDLVDKANQENE